MQPSREAIRSHAPSLGLALEGRVQLLEDGSFEHAAPRAHLEEFNPAPARKMFDRLKAFSRPTFSIVARCTGYNTFILSVMPFSLSYFGLTSKDLNWLRQAASKYILKRKWIEAEILPYILRYVGITTLLDPALSALPTSPWSNYPRNRLHLYPPALSGRLQWGWCFLIRCLHSCCFQGNILISKVTLRLYP